MERDAGVRASSHLAKVPDVRPKAPPATNWMNWATRRFHMEQKSHSDFPCSNLWPRGHEFNIMTIDLSHRICDGLLVSCRYWNHGGCLHKNKQKLMLCYFRHVLSGLVSASQHKLTPFLFLTALFWKFSMPLKLKTHPLLSTWSSQDSALP